MDNLKILIDKDDKLPNDIAFKKSCDVNNMSY